MTQPERAVLDAAEELVKAFGNHDEARYFAGFAPDATLIFYDHPDRLSSRAEWVELWREWEREHGFRVHRCESHDGVVHLLDADVAVFTHEVSTDLDFDGERITKQERETVVFRRDGDRWLVVHEHLSAT